MKKIFLIFLAGLLMMTACKNPHLNTLAQMGENDKELIEFQTEEGVLLEEDYEISDDIPVPSGVVTSKGQYRDKITIDWSPVVYKDHNVSYHIYRSEDGTNFIRLTGSHSIRENSWIDYQSVSKHYYYSVRTVIEDLELNSRMSSVHEGYTLGTPKRFSATYRQFEDRINLDWDPVAGATYYLIKRSVTETDSAPEWDYEYSIISDAVKGEKYTDFDVVAGKNYWYKLYAYYDESTESESSPVAQGAIVQVGAPDEVIIDYVTKGVMSDAVRISWEEADATKFIINKISQSEFESGNYIGTEIVKDKAELSTQVDGDITYYYYYDIDAAMEAGEQYYYRVAAQNTIGKGKPSAFYSSADYRKCLGFGISNPHSFVLPVVVTKHGYKISAPELPGVRGYYLFRSLTDPAGFTAAQWGSPLGYVTPGTHVDKPDGVDLESAQVWYRALAADDTLVTVAADGSLSNTVYDWSPRISIASIKNELTAISGYTAKIGYSDYTLPGDDYTVPVPVFTQVASATQDDEAYKGTVRLTGQISDTSGLEKLRVKLIRTCQYGDETGVFPLAEPRRAIGEVSFTKKGLPHIKGIEVFDLKQHMNLATGQFEFIDPMHDFRDGEVLIRNGQPDTVKWDYAAWDREAWKDIKRQKPFDLERAVKIQYEVRIERLGDPEWGANSSSATGWPALTDLQFAHFINWAKEPALNRLTYILIPRYGWSKTVSWLAGGGSQSTPGEYNKVLQDNGRGYLSVWAQGLGAAGRGSVRDNYSDWPGFVVNMKDDKGNPQEISLSVSLDANQKRHVALWFSVDTPLYDGTCFMSIYVRDYNYHWGLWEDAGKQGEFSIWHKNRGKVRFDPQDVIIFRGMTKGDTFGWEEWDTGGEGFSGSFTNSCLFSRINFKYRPVPVNQDFIKERDPVMYYGYQY